MTNSAKKTKDTGHNGTNNRKEYIWQARTSTVTVHTRLAGAT